MIFVRTVARNLTKGCRKGGWMDDLNRIRRVFPDWPSELDTAKASSNWAILAQAFYCASKVLYEELISADQMLHTTDGGPYIEKLHMRMLTSVPACFSLAFSLELASKAALVQQGKLKNLSGKEKIPFSHHSIVELAKKIDTFVVDHNTEEVLQWASDVIKDGKYPSSITPSDKKSGVPLTRSLGELLESAEPVYNRLMEICTQTPTQNPA